MVRNDAGFILVAATWKTEGFDCVEAAEAMAMYKSMQPPFSIIEGPP